MDDNMIARILVIFDGYWAEFDEIYDALDWLDDWYVFYLWERDGVEMPPATIVDLSDVDLPID